MSDEIRKTKSQQLFKEIKYLKALQVAFERSNYINNVPNYYELPTFEETLMTTLRIGTLSSELGLDEETVGKMYDKADQSYAK